MFYSIAVHKKKRRVVDGLRSNIGERWHWNHMKWWKKKIERLYTFGFTINIFIILLARPRTESDIKMNYRWHTKINLHTFRARKEENITKNTSVPSKKCAVQRLTITSLEESKIDVNKVAVYLNVQCRTDTCDCATFDGLGRSRQASLSLHLPNFASGLSDFIVLIKDFDDPLSKVKHVPTDESSILNPIPQLMNIPMWRIVINQIFLSHRNCHGNRKQLIDFCLRITSCASNTSLDADWFAIVLLKRFLGNVSTRQGNVTFRVRFGCAITTSLWENNDFYWNKFNVFFLVVRC